MTAFKLAFLAVAGGTLAWIIIRALWNALDRLLSKLIKYLDL